MDTMQFGVPIGFVESQHNRGLDILLIKLGGQCFGLPLSSVKQVCSIPVGFSSYGPAVEAHFIFEGNPVPYVSLWNVLKLESIYVEYDQMQAMLPQRRQDHLDWMDALEDAIRNGSTFSKSRNPRECAFGKWYYSYRTQDLRLSLMMRHFERPHADIHRLADRLLGMVEIGKVDNALQAFRESKNTTLAELLELFDSTRELVVELQRRIAVIVADEGYECALGADGVLEIAAIPPERIKRSTGIGAQAASALIVLDDETVAPLIDWRSFIVDGKTAGISPVSGLEDIERFECCSNHEMG